MASQGLKEGKYSIFIQFLEIDTKNQTSEFESVWGYEIDLGDKAYELISKYS